MIDFIKGLIIGCVAALAFPVLLFGFFKWALFVFDHMGMIK